MMKTQILTALLAISLFSKAYGESNLRVGGAAAGIMADTRGLDIVEKG